MNRQNRRIIFLMTLLIILLSTLSVLLIEYKGIRDSMEKISYNEFIELISKNQIKEVKINFTSETFTFTDLDNNEFITDNPRSIDFKKFLLENDVKVSVLEYSPSLIIFEIFFGLMRIVLIFIIFSFVMRKMGMKFFEKKEVSSTNIPNVRFENIAGNVESKNDIKFLVNFLKEPNKYHDMGAKLPKGVVLYGPPGTGKTLMAKAIAGEAGVPFLSVSGSDFVEMYVGLGAKRVRELFKEARAKAPCIVFIDEIDAVGTHRGGHGGNSEKDQTINALLAELDGFSSAEPIITIVATNRVEDLDTALIRPGRFDKHIAIGLPEYIDRLEIINKYSENKKIADDVSLEDLAKITIGFSGAGLEALMNEATILAVNKGNHFVGKEDIDDAYFKMVMGGHKKEKRDDVDNDELRLVAYHEAGHALCAKLLTTNSVPKVTIVPSTSGYGGATFNIPNKMGLMSKGELLNNIRVLYAGRCAEYILKDCEDDITTGASQDIKQATDYIKKYFNDYGMSNEFGIIKVSEFNNNQMVLGEAIKLSKKLYNETLDILIKNKSKLEMIAEELIVKETLNEDDLDNIINNQ